MGGELGSETYIDVSLVSSASSPPMFTLFGCSGTTFFFFFRISYGKVGAFEFSRISRRDRIGKKNLPGIFVYISHVQRCARVRSALPIFKS